MTQSHGGRAGRHAPARKDCEAQLLTDGWPDARLMLTPLKCARIDTSSGGGCGLNGRLICCRLTAAEQDDIYQAHHDQNDLEWLGDRCKLQGVVASASENEI